MEGGVYHLSAYGYNDCSSCASASFDWTGGKGKVSCYIQKAYNGTSGYFRSFQIGVWPNPPQAKGRPTGDDWSQGRLGIKDLASSNVETIRDGWQTFSFTSEAGTLWLGIMNGYSNLGSVGRNIEISEIFIDIE